MLLLINMQDIHLAAILQHPIISSLKPEAHQLILQQALRDHPRKILEVSSNKYFVRRKPSTYPPLFLPNNSFDVVDDEGLSFWDQRTIYVEPHLRHLASTPAKLAYHLEQHGQMRSKWLPIQAVHKLWNNCAFVVLSGSVMRDDIWAKWRAAKQPQHWNIMTKVEHTRRSAEYVALISKEKPPGTWVNRTRYDGVPPIARPAVLPMAETAVEGDQNSKTSGQKRKRQESSSHLPYDADIEHNSKMLKRLDDP
jgi:hypothetical protein